MIFSTIPAQAPARTSCPLAFVSGVPGETDICTGKPLTGSEGSLFNKMLRMAGIERSECWVGHVFNEPAPAGEDIKEWCQPDACGTHPRLPGSGFLRSEYQHHLERLGAELAAAQPRVIVPLGGLALWALAGTEKIGAARGAVGRATLVAPGVKILPTYHPTFVLGQYKHLVTAVGDLKKAKAEAERPVETMRLSKRELWLEPSLTDIAEFHLKHLVHSDLITIDIETAAGQITCVGFAADSCHAITIPFVDYRKVDRNYWPSVDTELAAWFWVKTICELPNPKLFQNGPYDNFWLLQRGIKVNNWREDTRLLSHALYPELPKSLAYMASVYCHQGAWKLMRRLAEAKADE